MDLKVSDVYGGDELKMLLDKWHEVVEKAGKISIAVRSSLIDVRPARVEKETVALAIDPEFAAEKKNLEIPRNRMAVEHVLGLMLGRNVAASFTVAEAPAVDSEEDATGDGERQAPPAEKVQHSAAQPKPKEKRKGPGRDIVKDPAVQKALEVFDGAVVEIRE